MIIKVHLKYDTLKIHSHDPRSLDELSMKTYIPHDMDLSINKNEDLLKMNSFGRSNIFDAPT